MKQTWIIWRWVPGNINYKTMAKKKKVYTSMISFTSRGTKKGQGSYESKKKSDEQPAKPEKKKK